jgi:hypothetical protein
LRLKAFAVSSNSAVRCFSLAISEEIWEGKTKGIFTILAAGSSVVAAISGASAEPAMMTDQELMNAIKDSASAAVLKDATILKHGRRWANETHQKGTGGFTCMNTPGGAMCADEAGMAWGEAWQMKAPPPQKLGFTYMLRGDNGTSNTDPYATKETAYNNWIQTGPHVMIVERPIRGMPSPIPQNPM